MWESEVDEEIGVDGLEIQRRWQVGWKKLGCAWVVDGNGGWMEEVGAEGWGEPSFCSWTRQSLVPLLIAGVILVWKVP